MILDFKEVTLDYVKDLIKKEREFGYIIKYRTTSLLQTKTDTILVTLKDGKILMPYHISVNIDEKNILMPLCDCVIDENSQILSLPVVNISVKHENLDGEGLSHNNSIIPPTTKGFNLSPELKHVASCTKQIQKDKKAEQLRNKFKR